MKIDNFWQFQQYTVRIRTIHNRVRLNYLKTNLFRNFTGNLYLFFAKFERRVRRVHISTIIVDCFSYRIRTRVQVQISSLISHRTLYPSVPFIRAAYRIGTRVGRGADPRGRRHGRTDDGQRPRARRRRDVSCASGATRACAHSRVTISGGGWWNFPFFSVMCAPPRHAIT